MTARPLIFDNTKIEIKAKHILASAVIVESYPQEKDMDDIKMSRLITRQLKLIKRLYDVFEKCEQQSGLKPNEIAKIKSEYDKLIQKYGAQILSVTRIIRSEVESATILKNANFSPTAIKELITQGEQKALEKIDKLRFLNSEHQLV
jgi:NTE family protein